jgi:DNA-binding NtrC family response regulator
MASPIVLVVSGSLEAQQTVGSVLGEWGLVSIFASTAREAEEILIRHPVSLIFCSDELVDSEVECFIQCCSHPPNQVPVVVVSRLDDCRQYLKCLQAGAFDYVLYPPNGLEIDRVLWNALKDTHFTRAQRAVSVA